MQVPALPDKVGLFGGSFDPVHNAHLALAQQALHDLQLDELLWVPTGVAWQKARALTASTHRLAMLQLAIGDAPRQRIEDCELRRGGPSYMLDTVRDLQQRRPGADWYLVIGQDQFTGLHTWHGAAELLRRVTLAVAVRPGHGNDDAAASVRAARRVELRMTSMAVSSTDIRERVARGQDIGALVPPAVAHYIRDHRLYLTHLESTPS